MQTAFINVGDIMKKKSMLGRLGRNFILVIDSSVIFAVMLIIIFCSVHINKMNNQSLEKEASIGVKLVQDEISTAEKQAGIIAATLCENKDFSRAFDVDRGNDADFVASLLVQLLGNGLIGHITGPDLPKRYRMTVT